MTSSEVLLLSRAGLFGGPGPRSRLETVRRSEHLAERMTQLLNVLKGLPPPKFQGAPVAEEWRLCSELVNLLIMSIDDREEV